MEKSNYQGVFYRQKVSKATGKEEKIFYVQYYGPNGQRHMEKVGSSLQAMTEAKASRIRSLRIEGKEQSNQEQREEAKKLVWTFDLLWQAYKDHKGTYAGRATDESNFNNHLSPLFGPREPLSLAPFDISRLRRELEAKHLQAQTIKHNLALLRRIARFGVSQQLCPGVNFPLELPKVDNSKTEDLTSEQLQMLLQVLEQETNIQAKNIMLLALFTGMRRGELFNLEWRDVDFQKGFILIRQSKGGKAQQIPLNQTTREILRNHERPFTESPYVFPGLNGGKLINIKRQVQRIKELAKLPADFRPMHGLRHVYASMLASSGKVDLYTLQKLLTHKSPQMTQRYAHLRDEALHRAANVVDELALVMKQGVGF